MNLERTDAIRNLLDAIDEFLAEVSEEGSDEAFEHEFLEDESRISNTELDDLTESLYHVHELAERLIE